jgi:hypothetical protein
VDHSLACYRRFLIELGLLTIFELTPDEVFFALVSAVSAADFVDEML